MRKMKPEQEWMWLGAQGEAGRWRGGGHFGTDEGGMQVGYMAAWCPPSEKTAGDGCTPVVRGEYMEISGVGDTKAGNRLALLPMAQFTHL